MRIEKIIKQAVVTISTVLPFVTGAAHSAHEKVKQPSAIVQKNREPVDTIKEKEKRQFLINIRRAKEILETFQATDLIQIYQIDSDLKKGIADGTLDESSHNEKRELLAKHHEKLVYLLRGLHDFLGSMRRTDILSKFDGEPLQAALISMIDDLEKAEQTLTTIDADTRNFLSLLKHPSFNLKNEVTADGNLHG